MSANPMNGKWRKTRDGAMNCPAFLAHQSAIQLIAAAGSQSGWEELNAEEIIAKALALSEHSFERLTRVQVMKIYERKRHEARKES